MDGFIVLGRYGRRSWSACRR